MSLTEKKTIHASTRVKKVMVKVLIELVPDVRIEVAVSL